jgi:transcriptional regulator with PAS, ATPase and Fis domain
MPRLSTAEHEEAEKIRAIIERHPHNRPEAARVLGMSRTSLWQKMRKYGLNKP